MYIYIGLVNVLKALVVILFALGLDIYIYYIYNNINLNSEIYLEIGLSRSRYICLGINKYNNIYIYL